MFLVDLPKRTYSFETQDVEMTSSRSDETQKITRASRFSCALSTSHNFHTRIYPRNFKNGFVQQEE